MSDQPSGKVSAQKPASSHLKTVLINTVVPSHFCQDYRRVQAGQLRAAGTSSWFLGSLSSDRIRSMNVALPSSQPCAAD